MDPVTLSPDAVLAIRKLVLVRNYKPVISDQEIDQAYGRHCAILRDYTTRTPTFEVSA